MSVVVTIHQNKLFKKKITLEQLLRNKLRYGKFNDNYVLEDGQKDENNAILYHPQHIARGIDVFFKDNKDIELSMLIPTTNEEIDDFYDLVFYLCKICHTKTFVQDEVERYVDEIEKNKQNIKEFNYDSLCRFLHDNETGMLMCAMWPLYFKSSEVMHWLDDQTLSTFSKELHQFQIKDLYYANALCYKVNNEDGSQSIIGIYVVTATVDTIFPLEPQVPLSCMNLQTGKQINVDNYRVALCSNEQNKILGEISFEDFMNELMRKEVHEFDNRHIYFDGLSEEEVSRIYQLYKN